MNTNHAREQGDVAVALLRLSKVVSNLRIDFKNAVDLETTPESNEEVETGMRHYFQHVS